MLGASDLIELGVLTVQVTVGVVALVVTAVTVGRIQSAWLGWWLKGARAGSWPHRSKWKPLVGLFVPRWRGLVARAAMDAYMAGDLDRAALFLSAATPEALAETLAWNQALCVLIALGRYREALAVPRAEYRDLHPAIDCLLRINEAEAMACLGRGEQALAHVAALQSDEGILRGGLAAHRAWVLATLGRPAEARAALKTGKASDLPNDFRSEFHFAGAFVALAEGNVVRAREEVVAGLKVAQRPSSNRNGLFLLARIAALEGRVDEALRLYAEGAAHRFTGQGGDALLAWGDLLSSKGDPAGATHAWTLATQRDPESPAAEVARQRMASSTGPQPG